MVFNRFMRIFASTDEGPDLVIPQALRTGIGHIDFKANNYPGYLEEYYIMAQHRDPNAFSIVHVETFKMTTGAYQSCQEEVVEQTSLACGVEYMAKKDKEIHAKYGGVSNWLTPSTKYIDSPELEEQIDIFARRAMVCKGHGLIPSI